jgi:hypothetical protein
MLQVRDATGSTAGVVWVVYSASTAQAAFTATFEELLHASVIMLMAAVVLLFFLIIIVWHKWEQHVLLAQASLDEVSKTNKSIILTNPLPAVPLTEALVQMADAEKQLKVLDQQVAALLK